MRKYWFIYKSEVMTALQYMGDFLLHATGYVLMIFIFINLWNYMYDDPTQLINGYSKSQMIWYVIFTEILWSSSGGRKFCRKICNDVRTGNIAYNINKPYSYVGYVLFNHLGEATVKAAIYILIGITMGAIFVGNIPSISILSFVFLVFASVFAIVINDLFTIMVSLVSFFIEDSTPLYWLYSKFLLIVGTIFPLELFPEQLQGFIKCSPIYVINYGPAKIFVDFNLDLGLRVIGTQLIYILVVTLLCLWVFKRGARKLTINGG